MAFLKQLKYSGHEESILLL